MTAESMTDRVLKLPLDSPFDATEGHSHSHVHDHDHSNESRGQDENGRQHDVNRQQEGTGQFDPVSLAASVPSGFGNVNDDNSISSGIENGRASPAKRHQDTSLSAAAAAAVASIQDVWSENFNEPLPTNKEERIQQALEFMHSEKQAHDSDKNIKKHSIRQIALFFQVPKSTLYDRLKSKTNESHTNTGVKPLSRRNSSPKSRIISSSRAHQQQMKLSIEKEDFLLNEVRDMCHSYGNTLNYTHIREFIISLVNGVSLGKKWIHNFTRRHEDFVIYGSYNSRFNVKMKSSKSCRCNFDYLWRCFVPLLQESIQALPQDNPFYYITRTCIHQPSMSSVFTCFAINPSDMSMKSISAPKLVLFPDYFGKIYLHQNHSSNNNNNNNNNNMPANNNMDDNDEDKDNDNDDNSDSNSQDHASGFKASSIASDINNGESNPNSLNDEKKEPISEHSLKINKQERKQRQTKVDKLNEVFAEVYATCNQHNLNFQNHKAPFVIFEGLDDRYYWDTLTCKNMVQTDKFLALPWNKHIFQRIIAANLQQVIESVAQSSSIVAIESPSFETDLNGENLNMEAIVQEFSLIFNLQRELLNTTEDQQEHDTVQLNDIDAFEPALHEASAAAAAATAASVNSTNGAIHVRTQQNNALQKSTQPSHIETVTSANIFENSTMSQLQDVINMIDNNESQLYGDLMSSSSKTTLMNIFSKIKGIVPQ